MSVFHIAVAAFFLRSAAADDEPSICEEGGKGLVFPLFGSEHSWPPGVQALAYFCGLMYLFFGVSIIADVFMSAIEVITSKTREVMLNGVRVEYGVWNATVANLTLMALGSSAPEILLCVIEIFSGDFFSGSLGPSTIVGSAAINLFGISALCMVALPEGEGRTIKETGVFLVTALTSIFAYVWLLAILQWFSPNVVTITEGVLTFIFFPVLVWSAYLTDVGFWASCKSKSSVAPSDSLAHRVTTVSGGGLTAKQSKAIARQVQAAMGSSHEDDAKAVEMIKLLALQTIKPSRAARRMEAIRSFTGGKRVLPSTKALTKSNETATAVAAQAHSPGPCVLQFKSDMYMVCEGDGRVFVVVRRSHAVGPCSVSYASVGGTATADVDYVSVQGTLLFEDGVFEKRIGIDIIDDDEPEDDEFFTVVLSNPSSDCSLGEWHTTTVLIIDDDEPGDIGFDQACSEVSVLESKPFVELTARRFNGSKGRIECKYRTKDMNVPNAAKAGLSYVASEGVLVFEAQQMQQQIQVQLLDNEKYNQDEVFKVVLFDPQGPTSDVAVHTHEDGSSAGDCRVIIVNDDAARAVEEQVSELLASTVSKYQIGSSNWSQQFFQACQVNGGDFDPDEPPSLADYCMHCLLFPFKLAFAFVPPSSYGGGWYCFIIALVFIGMVTALIQDMAALLGCSLGIPDMVTAISIVAIGTSLPDAFASKAATISDDSADAAIGNVTGSNCVNVFLGLGLPWMIAAIKWHASGVTPEWTRRYGDSHGNAGTDSQAPTLGMSYPAGAFVVPSSDLGFSVAVFVVCALLCFALFYDRRNTHGCELGGPQGTTAPAAGILVGLWLIYLVLSILRGTGAI